MMLLGLYSSADVLYIMGVALLCLGAIRFVDDIKDNTVVYEAYCGDEPTAIVVNVQYYDGYYKAELVEDGRDIALPVANCVLVEKQE